MSMSMLATPSRQPIALPPPRVPITIRPGVAGDVPFLDSLQKLHSKQVGWMPTAQFEGKIRAGHVIVAEEAVASDQWPVASERREEGTAAGSSLLATGHSPLT